MPALHKAVAPAKACPQPTAPSQPSTRLTAGSVRQPARLACLHSLPCSHPACTPSVRRTSLHGTPPHKFTHTHTHTHKFARPLLCTQVRAQARKTLVTLLMETEHPDSAHGDRTPRLCSWRPNTPTLLMETEHPDSAHGD
eukprot:366087-Chlamydomonas_euryale.AAC.7